MAAATSTAAVAMQRCSTVSNKAAASSKALLAPVFRCAWQPWPCADMWLVHCGELVVCGPPRAI
jgi:hypothetical protein